MYHVDDPINFMTSFYGCLIAGIIPVPIEPPASKDVSSCFWLPTVILLFIGFICCFCCCCCCCCWRLYFPGYVMHFREEVKSVPLPGF